MSSSRSDDGASSISDLQETPITSQEQSVIDDFDSLRIATETQNLIDRSKTLLDELNQFSAYLQLKRKTNRVEHRHYLREIKTDLKGLERLCKKSEEGAQSQVSAFHAVKSSNIPFLEAVWSVAKESRDVVGLKRTGHLVDVVADGGLRWIKVSTTTEIRLLMEMANKGWEWQDQASDDDQSEDDDLSDVDRSLSDGDDVGLNLFTMSKTLMDSTRKTRIRYRHPSLDLILTRIEDGKNKDIDRVLDSIRALGVNVLCITPSAPIPLRQDILERMVPDDWAAFSDVLNIDCTILLALVSDISYAEVPEKEGFNRAIRRQIEIENEEQLLPMTLWPALIGRRLICTSEAAQRMHEIVDTIGTETEKARTQYMMGMVEGGADHLLDQLQQFSTHSVPRDLRLPIEVVKVKVDSVSCGDVIPLGLESQTLPPSAKQVESQLSAINASVFLLGWATNITTITSNKTVAKQVESWVEEFRESEDELGPRMWVCPTSRSLVAKEKDRRDGRESFKKS